MKTHIVKHLADTVRMTNKHLSRSVAAVEQFALLLEYLIKYLTEYSKLSVFGYHFHFRSSSLDNQLDSFLGEGCLRLAKIDEIASAN